MTDYELLLQTAYELGFPVIERYDFDVNKISGLATRAGILLSSSLESDRERRCVLAEEIAHEDINSGNIVDLSELSNRKQEIRAHKQAVSMLVPFETLVKTVIELRYESDIYNVAFELNVTEEFLLEAINIYSTKYGPVKDYGAYIVYFNPFRVVEKQKI